MRKNPMSKVASVAATADEGALAAVAVQEFSRSNASFLAAMAQRRLDASKPLVRPPTWREALSALPHVQSVLGNQDVASLLLLSFPPNGWCDLACTCRSLHHQARHCRLRPARTPTPVEPEVFSEELIAEYREAFRLFDEDGVGTISIDYARRLLRSLGHPLSEAEKQEMMDTLGVGPRSSAVDFCEIMDMLRRKVRVEEVAAREELYIRCARSRGDGVMTAIDVRLMVHDFEETQSQIAIDKLADDMVRAADPTGSGWIDRADFQYVVDRFL